MTTFTPHTHRTPTPPPPPHPHAHPPTPTHTDVSQRCVEKQDHGLQEGLDPILIHMCKPALPDDVKKTPKHVYLQLEVRNTHR